MKAIILRSAVAFVGLLMAASVSQAYYWVAQVSKCPYPVAPSPCHGGFYLMDCYGRVTGPHYYLVPPCCVPCNGPAPPGQAVMSQVLQGSVRAPAGFPTHPFVRSPRDFFMWGDTIEDEQRQRARPNLLP